MTDQKPTVVLVHGAFADACELRAGHTPAARRGASIVRVAAGTEPQPVRGQRLHPAGSSSRSTDRSCSPVTPTAERSSPSRAPPTTRRLVYVAGYALDEGESLGQLQGGFPDSELAANLMYAPYPTGPPTARTSRSRSMRSPDMFAAGVDPKAAQVLAVSQRPLVGVRVRGAARSPRGRPSRDGTRLRRGPHDQPRGRAVRVIRAGGARRRGRSRPHLVIRRTRRPSSDIIETALAGVKLPA